MISCSVLCFTPAPVSFAPPTGYVSELMSFHDISKFQVYKLRRGYMLMISVRRRREKIKFSGRFFLLTAVHVLWRYTLSLKFVFVTANYQICGTHA